MSSIAQRRRALLSAIILVPVALWVAAKTGGSADSENRGGSVSPAARVSPKAVPPSSVAGAFAPGACVSFLPSHGAPRGVVFLDAGHGGIDPGTSGKTSDGRAVAEKTASLAVVQATTERLRAAGYRVVMSRTSDTTVRVPGTGDVRSGLLTPLGVRRDLLARIACANAARAQALISVHMNAFSDPAEGGTMTLYDPDRSFASANRRLAGFVQTALVTAFQRRGWRIQDRSIRADTEIKGQALTAGGARYGHEIMLGPRAPNWVPSPSLMPAAIVEPLFLTRPFEADLASSPASQAALGEAIAAAVDQFLAG